MCSTKEVVAVYLDLTDALRGPGQTLEKSLDITPQFIGDIELCGPVRGLIRVEHARQNIVVSGRAQTAIVVPCSRCLQPTCQALELEFEAVAPLHFFQPAFSGSHHMHHDEDEEEASNEADDELAALFEGHSLDVLELVRQAIELQAPIQPLCSPDCPGLPEAAQYSAAPGDDRWSALKNWDDHRHWDDSSSNGSRQES